MSLTSGTELNDVSLPLEGAIRELFPLPLSPFEVLMLLDDRPELPMTFCVQMVFRGQIDRVAFQQAVDHAVRRHPLLRARVAWPGKRPVWMLPDFQSAPVMWLEEHQARGDTLRSLDLARDSGLCIVAQAGESHTKVWLHLHHACWDGAGARRFMVDVLTGYAQIYDADSAPTTWDELDYSLLTNRHHFPGLTGAATKVSTSWWKKLRDAFHFHVLTPRPLASANSKTPGPPRTTPIHRHVFSSKDFLRFRQLTREQEVSLNDVAMALLFVTLADWNRTFGPSGETHRLRIMMPTDLRSAADDRLPATNRMSFSFLARTSRDCQEWETLLRGIRAESKYIQEVRIGLDFLGGIGLAQCVPGLLPLMLRLPRCMATALLTNLGDPTKRFRRRFPAQGNSVLVGNLVLEQLFGSPPLRPYVHAGFGLCVCADQLCISLVGNHQVLGDRADDLMQSYVRQWQAWERTS
jgi:hypothetical protein